MHANPLKPRLIALFSLILLGIYAAGSRVSVRTASAKDRIATESSSATRALERESAGTIYQWNISDKEQPLLGFSQDHLNAGFDQSLSYATEQFDFLIFKPLAFDDEQKKFLLPIISKDRRATFIEFIETATANLYRSAEGTELLDKDSLKIIKASDGAKYLFVRYPDGEFRCATIKRDDGATLNLLYSANGLALHGVVDSSGRSLTFNYGEQGIQSLTQTWMSSSQGFTKTWALGEEKPLDLSTKFAHAVSTSALKSTPSNAVVRVYTDEMAASDKLLAQIFGGPNAVAGANGFEPAGLAAMYPFYRGDVIGDDGRLRPGHLSHAMHLYGSPDGKSDSPLYVPAGFTSHSSEPSPTDAAVLFYYPKLGNLTDVTLAIFHVADFKIVQEGDRVRIGSIGGLGGSSPLYKHSHIEFYRGNRSLPPAAERAALRIDPPTVFGK